MPSSRRVCRRNSSPHFRASAQVSTAPSLESASRQPDRIDVQLGEELDQSRRASAISTSGKKSRLPTMTPRVDRHVSSPYLFKVAIVVGILGCHQVAGNNLPFRLAGAACFQKSSASSTASRAINTAGCSAVARRAPARMAATASGLPSKPVMIMPLLPADFTAAAAPSAMVSLPAMMPRMIPVRLEHGLRLLKRLGLRPVRRLCGDAHQVRMPVEHGVKAVGAHLRIGVRFPAQQLDVVSALEVRSARTNSAATMRAPWSLSAMICAFAIPSASISRSIRKHGMPALVARRTAAMEESAPALSRMMAAALEAIAASIRLSCR